MQVFFLFMLFIYLHFFRIIKLPTLISLLYTMNKYISGYRIYYLLLLSILGFPTLAHSTTFSGSFKGGAGCEIVFHFLYNPVTQQRYQHWVTLDSTGSFSFDFPITFLVEVGFEIESYFGHLISFPNTLIDIRADINNIGSTIQITGAKQSLSNHLPQLYDFSFYNTSPGIENLDHKADLAKKEIKEKKIFFDSLYNINLLSNDERVYANSYLQYFFSDYKMSVLFKQYKLNDKVFDFLNSLGKTDDSSALMSDTYNSLIEFGLLRNYLIKNNIDLDSIVDV